MRSRAIMALTSPPKCRLCRWPVKFGGVDLSKVNKYKLRKWWSSNVDSALEDKIKKDSWFCEHCYFHARRKHLKEKGPQIHCWWPNLRKDKKLFNIFLEHNIKSSIVILNKVESLGDINAPTKTEELPVDDNSSESTILFEILLKEQPAPLVKPELPFAEIDEDAPLSSIFPRKNRNLPQEQLALEPQAPTPNLEQTAFEPQEPAPNLEKTAGLDQSTILETTPKKSHPRERRTPPRITLVQCTLCDGKFHSRTNCLLHIRKEHAEDVFPCKIADCRACYANPYELSRHAWFKHRDSFKFRPCMKGASIVVPPAPSINIPQHEFFCYICRRAFKGKRFLTTHMIRMHKPNFVAMGSLRHPKSSRCLQCDHCSCDFSKKGSLENHMLRAHFKANQRRVVKKEELGNDCPYCFQTFKRLASHIRNSHPKDGYKRTGWCKVERRLSEENPPEEKTFSCKTCKKVFGSRRNLTRHVRRMHFRKSAQPPAKLQSVPAVTCFWCAHCTNGYLGKSSLQDHILSKHLRAPPVVKEIKVNHICPFCNKSFSRLASHIKNSHPEHDLTSPEQAVIQVKVEPPDEQEWEVEEPAPAQPTWVKQEPPFNPLKRRSFKCRYCAHELFSYTGMYLHERKTHQDKMVKCADATCTYTFFSISRMEAHVRSMHTPVRCEFCLEIFCPTSLLMEHIRVSHQCGRNQCKRYFKYQTEMDKHVQKDHAEDQNHNEQAVRVCFRCGQPNDPARSQFACRCNKTCQVKLEEGNRKLYNHYCSLCSKVFTTSAGLKRHMTVSHPPDNIWAGQWRGLMFQAQSIKCNACKIFFVNKESLCEHLALAHSGVGSC